MASLHSLEGGFFFVSLEEWHSPCKAKFGMIIVFNVSDCYVFMNLWFFILLPFIIKILKILLARFKVTT